MNSQKMQKPKMLSPMFTAKVQEIKNFLAMGEIDAAMDSLNEVWRMAGKNKANRAAAHELGNEIQKFIFAKCETGAEQ